MFAAGARPVIVAHQGGWDEVLLIGGPIIIIAGLLILAKKRVDSALPDSQDSESSLNGGADGGEAAD
jgi:hypothetical protein